MKKYFLKWQGTIIVYQITAETLTKAKIKFCEQIIKENWLKALKEAINNSNNE